MVGAAVTMDALALSETLLTLDCYTNEATLVPFLVGLLPGSTCCRVPAAT